MLVEQEAQRRKEARGRFVAGIWSGKQPEELISLAAEAGLTVAVAEELLNKVEQARDQVQEANRLPRLRKEAQVTQAHLDKVHAYMTAQTERLESQVEDASIAASCARQAVNAAEEAARQLLALHDQGLLPASELPKEVAFLMRRRQAEEAAYKASQVRVGADRERANCRARVWQVEQQLANLPISITTEWDESRLTRALKAAKDDLHQAEKRLQAAETAAHAAVRAIP